MDFIAVGKSFDLRVDGVVLDAEFAVGLLVAREDREEEDFCLWAVSLEQFEDGLDAFCGL